MDRLCTSKLRATMTIRISSTVSAATMESNCTAVVPDKDLWEAVLEGHLPVEQDPPRTHISHMLLRMSVSVLPEVASSSNNKDSSRDKDRDRLDRAVHRVKGSTVVSGLAEVSVLALVGLNRAPIISRAGLKGICTPSKVRTMRASTIRARVGTGSK